jgi:uncharacterized protein (TIGR01777 family)
MRIVVAGGTGFLGHPLVERLRRRHDVLVLTRHPRDAGQIGWSSAGDGGGWAAAVHAADVVVNLAGEPIAGSRWTDARKTAIRNSRIDATRAIVGAIRNGGRAQALVNASAIGIYGDRRDEPLTEASPAGNDFLASVCTEWEGAALEAADLTRVVLLRTGLVLDDGGGALPPLALPFRLFVGGPMGSGRQQWSWIHRDDWIEMVCWSIDNTAVSGPLNVTAPEPVTNAVFARELGRALHRPALMPTPAFAMRLVLGEMADAMILGGQRVLPAKATALGFSFRYRTLRDALAAIYKPQS